MLDRLTRRSAVVVMCALLIACTATPAAPSSAPTESDLAATPAPSAPAGNGLGGTAPAPSDESEPSGLGSGYWPSSSAWGGGVAGVSSVDYGIVMPYCTVSRQAQLPCGVAVVESRDTGRRQRVPIVGPCVCPSTGYKRHLADLSVDVLQLLGLPTNDPNALFDIYIEPAS